MTKMFAVWELLQSVTLLVVWKTYEAAYNAVVYVGISVSNYTHFYEVSWVNALLNHIVDAVLTKSFYSSLMLLNRLLNISKRAIIHLTSHLLIMVDSSKQLQRGFLDRSWLFDLWVSVENEADVAENEHVRKDEPENKEGVWLILLMRTLANSLPTIDFHEEYSAEYSPENEERCDDSHLGHRYGT